SDLYEHSGRRPTASINFVSAHDGFTLEDLVSYERKHNEANGEGNRDGHEPNDSSNGGVEGPTDDPAILAKRERRKTNLLATLLLSQGVPMLLGGDELSRTQHGNNNAYCRDDATSWYDWTLDARKRRFLATVRRLVALRGAHPVFSRRRFPREPHEIEWIHPSGRPMTGDDWRADAALPLGLLLDGRSVDPDLSGRRARDDTFLLVFHRGERAHRFALPPPRGGGRWTLEWASAEGAALGEGELAIPPESVCVVREEASVAVTMDP